MTARTAAMTLALAAASACTRGPAGGRTGTPDAGCRNEADCAPTASSVSLNRLWGSAPDDIWAVGDGGLILHFDGRAWQRVASGTTAELRAIAGHGGGDVWIAGANHTILRVRGSAVTREDPRRDGGAGPLTEDIAFEDLWVATSGEVWVAGGASRQGNHDGEFFDTCVLGRHEKGRWLFDRDDDRCGPLQWLWGTGSSDVWARSTGGETIVHWNGKTLVKHHRRKPPPRLGRHGFAGGWRLARMDGLLTHPDRPLPPTGQSCADFWAFGADDVWAILAGGSLFHFDGRGWTEARIPPP